MYMSFKCIHCITKIFDWGSCELSAWTWFTWTSKSVTFCVYCLLLTSQFFCVSAKQRHKQTEAVTISITCVCTIFIPWLTLLVLSVPLCLEWNSRLYATPTIVVVTVPNMCRFSTMFTEPFRRVWDSSQWPQPACCKCDLLFHSRHSKIINILLTKYHTALITAIS